MITVKEKKAVVSVSVELPLHDLVTLLCLLKANKVDHDAISMYTELAEACRAAGYFPP